jgi:2-oxoisovalerate dehydrogenase E1 component
MKNNRAAEFHARIFRSLYRIRRTEEEIVRVYSTDKIKSPVHLSIGQEAVAVGVCEALLAEDVVFGTYRGHAMYLAKGGDLNKMIAELYGKIDGCARGKGGSMHLVDVAHGVMGTSAVVASTISNAVGYAYALKYRKSPSIVVSFFGDGATEEGAFYENLNFAALKQLPIIFVCENNLYAIHTHQNKRQSSANICERVRPFGIPAEKIPDNDVLMLYEKIKLAAATMRARNSGPVLFECMTYRWKEHVGPNEDFALGFRSADELLPWRNNDQLDRIAALIDPQTRETVEAEVEAEIKHAFEFAEASPFPPEAELSRHLFEAS